ncbi:MAG: U32 family peptidase [bacterium]
MKLTYFLRPTDDLEKLSRNGVAEVLIGSKQLSRLGAFDQEQMINAAKQAKKLSLKAVLLCDALVSERDFPAYQKRLEAVLPYFESARALDPGVMQFLFDKSSLKLQFVADTGNHNLPGLLAWENYFGDRLERLVLSIELSKESLSHIIPALKTPCELLVLGRILLFHSPRNLLSPLAGDVTQSDWIEATGASEESPHKGFPLVENLQGSFMFLAKDFCLAEQIDDLRAMELDYMRFDPTGCSNDLAYEISSILLSDSPKQAKELWPNPVIRGFYGVNKSDVLFKKLKNPSRDKTHALAEVLDVRKGEPMTVKVLDGSSLKLGLAVKMITPEGKIKEFSISSIKTLDGDALETAPERSIVTLQAVGSACVKALLLPKF